MMNEYRERVRHFYFTVLHVIADDPRPLVAVSEGPVGIEYGGLMSVSKNIVAHARELVERECTQTGYFIVNVTDAERDYHVLTLCFSRVTRLTTEVVGGYPDA